jgi:hypothetical protein
MTKTTAPARQGNTDRHIPQDKKLDAAYLKAFGETTDDKWHRNHRLYKHYGHEAYHAMLDNFRNG